MEDVNTTLTTSPAEAARFIQGGGLVAFPTETVYGLGADVFQPDAVRKLFAAKGRPSDNPLIVHLPGADGMDVCAAQIPDVARRLTDRFWPGPLTVILPKADGVPSVVTAGLGTVGLRVPAHRTAHAFLVACDTPVAAPSANRSGRPSPTTWEAVYHDLEGRIACILKSDRTKAGVESTVVDCTVTPPAVLRPGAISLEAVRRVVPGAVVTEGDDEEARSPGTRHRHYAPVARVHLVSSPSEAEPSGSSGYIGLASPARADRFGELCVASDVDEYAHEVFHFFRTCDAAGCSTIYAQTVPSAGLGRALNDRLRRAAAR